ncbi:MAG: carbohydrate kinase, partial [Alphaproteobacteria bacterium]
LLTQSAPFSVVSTGTWVVSFAVGGRPGELDPMRDTLANVDAQGRAVPSARFMGGREFDLLTGGDVREPDAQVLQRVIDDGIMILPSIVEGSGPYPKRKAEWDRANVPDVQNAAASLYAALMTRTCLELIGAAGPTIVEGPFAANRIYCSALRSLTGRKVVALPGMTGTSLGAALLAGADIRPRFETGEVPPLPAAFDRYAAEWQDAAGR